MQARLFVFALFCLQPSCQGEQQQKEATQGLNMGRKFPTWGQAEKFAEMSKCSPARLEVDVRPTPLKAVR